MSKKDWGNGNWYLFHTLAEKIDEKYFSDNKNYILNIILKICSNLPCPECAHDSVMLYKSANIDGIKTKEDFKQFFFIFHNKVNAKLNKPPFLKDELDKYKLAKTINIINNFIKVYFVSLNKQYY